MSPAALPFFAGGFALFDLCCAAQVSPTYAWEVSGHGAIAPHVGKFHGIRNGIDADIWDPLGDEYLPVSALDEQ